MREAQQRAIDVHGDRWTVALKGDSASIEARRVLDRRISAEQVPCAPANAPLEVAGEGVGDAV